MAYVPGYAEKVAQAFVEGKEEKSPLSSVGRNASEPGTTGRRLTTNGKVLLSYDWWVVADRGCPWSSNCIRVTTRRYQTGTWKSGKPKYSPTTDGHIQAVRDALVRAGYDHLSGHDGEWDHYMK
jgi:hypothetical protein